MTSIETSVARKNFASIVKAANRGERVLLKRHGKKVAAVVSVSDLAILHALEDRLDNVDADVALKDVEESGTVSWEEAKARLGL